MPVIVALIGAVGSGLTYWFIFGNGQEVLAAWMRDRRDAKRRAQSRDTHAKASARAITDTRDAAIVMMVTVAGLRGDITPEQEAVIKHHIAETLGLAADVDKRLVLAKFTKGQTQTPLDVIEGVKTLMISQLGSEAREQLQSMLEDVAKVHGGPSDTQQRFIENGIRSFKPLV
jgi:hypothetical protein